MEKAPSWNINVTARLAVANWPFSERCEDVKLLGCGVVVGLVNSDGKQVAYNYLMFKIAKPLQGLAARSLYFPFWN